MKNTVLDVINRSSMNRAVMYCLAALALCVACKFRKDYVPDKKLTIETAIIDSAQVLSAHQQQSLFKVIHDLENEVGPQIAILTIKSLNGKDIESYSLAQAEKMKLGRKRFADGILLTLVVNDRVVRIEVGYGLELIIKDEIASRITRKLGIPEYKNQNYYQGINLSVKAIDSLIRTHKPLIGKSPK